ncbi:hypothetical protein JTB14_004623 [Gonioctena quinquepunctata]|nr:hypothetical protein JTB14_004623 [Gonioctena quinquepunctata]
MLNLSFFEKSIEINSCSYHLKQANLQYRKKQLGILYHITSFQPVNFEEVDLRRKARTKLTVPTNLQQINQRLVPIATAKYNGIMDLLPFVSSEFHQYCRSLPHAPNRNDYSEGDTD